ncbi:MAG: LysM peptidoglycan-binding domain-containing protein [Treponema sp.]|nr:LysM peptidoglycan-binding domain-containing protein [Treponema sp.]
MKKLCLFILLAAISLSYSFADTTYVVQKGDTLYSLSKKFQLTVGELRAANNLSENDVIKVGQKITVPEADIGTAAALSSTNTNSNLNSIKTKLYTVQKGDTLYSLARKNNLTVADLLALNNFDSSKVIKIGEKIKIPDLPVNTGKTSSSKSSNTSTSNAKPAIEKVPDTRNYGNTIKADSNTVWPVKNPKVTQIKGKVSGVQLSAAKNESVTCIHEGTVMYVGVYRGFGQVVFVQSKTGLIYAYTGLGSVDVNKGDYLLSKEKIGSAGLDSITGNSQITFMVFQNGQPIDPSKAPRN